MLLNSSDIFQSFNLKLFEQINQMLKKIVHGNTEI